MPSAQGQALIDRNQRTIAVDGVTGFTSKTFTGNNTTVATPIFGITGSVEVRAIWGVVTTVIGANHTASAWRINDQSANPDITLSTGTDISAAAVGSIIVKKGLAAAALTASTSASGRVTEPTTLETTYFSPFVVVQKTAGVATNIEYVYATTDTPTSGAMQFFVRWLPLSAGAKLTPM